MPRTGSRTVLITLLTCMGSSALFGWLSYSAALTKSATIDEPLHVVSAYAATYLHDFRVDPENPPLWKYWPMVPLGRDGLHIDTNSALWHDAVTPHGGSTLATVALYQTSANDGEAIINTARGAMVGLGVLVILLTAAWAYRIAGASAAIIATTVLAFDPTLLAHAAIVKNDVAMSLMMLVLAMALTCALSKLTIGNIVLIAIGCGAAMSIKFSGLLYPLIAGAALLIRAMQQRTWDAAWFSLRSRIGRLVAIGVVAASTAIIGVIMIWASYGFRYAATSQPVVPSPVDRARSLLAVQQLSAELNRDPNPDELSKWTPPSLVRLPLFLDRHQLLPQSWTAGFVGLAAAMAHQQNFLLGEVKWGGWWYYFPLAAVFKTPVATLAAVIGAVVMLASRKLALDDRSRRALAVIAITIAIYLLFAVVQDINHGIRHLLPLYPIVATAIGITVAKSLAIRPKPALAATVMLGVALVAESLPAFPNYINFFNLPSRPCGPLNLLADSNLDWGQDLPALAAWREKNRDVRLYLAYFGTADPAAYGIDYVNLPGGFYLGPPAENPAAPGVMAISATRLQGLHMSDSRRRLYAQVRSWPVREILPGGTIYLFDYPPPQMKSGGAIAPPASTSRSND